MEAGLNRRCEELAKIGRPKAEEPHNNKVMVRFTDKEYQKLKERAKKENLTIAETARKGIEHMLNSDQ